MYRKFILFANLCRSTVHVLQIFILCVWVEESRPTTVKREEKRRRREGQRPITTLSLRPKIPDRTYKRMPKKQQGMLNK